MLGIKKIDLFILRKFFQMFLGCFLICLFVFMMQFVWKHIETMVGKGLGLDILARFFFYMGVSLVPMALPMSVLLTS
ncbi:MAG: LptF/LptG family permease, partial [Bacteroidaceae bacterium]